MRSDFDKKMWDRKMWNWGGLRSALPTYGNARMMQCPNVFIFLSNMFLSLPTNGAKHHDIFGNVDPVDSVQVRLSQPPLRMLFKQGQMI